MSFYPELEPHYDFIHSFSLLIVQEALKNSHMFMIGSVLEVIWGTFLKACLKLRNWKVDQRLYPQDKEIEACNLKATEV